MNTLPVSLPHGFTSLVAVGDTLTPGEKIAQYTIPDEQTINIPSELEIPLKKVKHSLKKNPGEAVQIGDVIAVKKNFFGSEQAAIISQVAGTVIRYERATGNLIIRITTNAPVQALISPVAGTVALCDNKQIVISTTSESIAGTKAVGQSREGEFFLLDDAGFFHLDNRAIGKVVIGHELTREMLSKAIGIGVIGLVGTEITDHDLAYMAERNAQIPIIAVASHALEQLRKWETGKIYLDITTKTITKIV